MHGQVEHTAEPSESIGKYDHGNMSIHLHWYPTLQSWYGPDYFADTHVLYNCWEKDVITHSRCSTPE